MWGKLYISFFADKFKLSKTFDVANSHEWTLFLHNSEEPYVIQSIHWRKLQEKFILEKRK